MAIKNKAVSGALDFLGLSSRKAATYIDSGKGKAPKYLSTATRNYDKATAAGVTFPADRGNTIRNAAIRRRQMQVGARYAAGGVAVGGIGMYRNKGGSRGGYVSPSTRAPRGSGRFA
jgi:hypothetical protein